MSIQRGNEYFRRAQYELALKEYAKIDKSNPLYSQAVFNAAKARQLMASTSNDASAVGDRLISIIMPVFNVGPYLDASILSVLNQSYTNFELIIVDDASTDEGRAIVDMYARIDDRVRVIQLEHNTLGGAGIPSNIGIQAAKGDYIGFVDSDDWIVRDAFEAMLSAASRTDADVVIADFCNFDQDSRKVEIAYDKKNWEGLPLGEAFSPREFPAVFRLSPVPWRKLYKKSFMEKNNIFFPEGDYFYEDNPFHWFVLSNASSVVLVDKVTTYHRMARQGQTMGALSFKLSALLNHVNTVSRYFAGKAAEVPTAFWAELVDWGYRSEWVVAKQEDPRIKEILKKRYAQVCSKTLTASGIPLPDVVKKRPAYAKRLQEYSNARDDLDLTIILPAFNCEEFIGGTLEQLGRIHGIKIEVFIVDDGSTDKTSEICREWCHRNSNFYLFEQKNRGAGRARNAVIPLATGEYTYFLDADDVVHTEFLEEAVRYARDNKHDLLICHYMIEEFEAGKTRNMFNADAELLSAMRDNDGQRERARFAAGLINYPWNRIIKTELLHGENIFFGPTIVHNDIPYHWHSIVAARSIGLFENPICTHRKFESKSQITNIRDHRRLGVFEELRHTHKIISRYENYQDIYPVWVRFTRELLVWARSRVPEELQGTFEESAKVLAEAFGGDL